MTLLPRNTSWTPRNRTPVFASSLSRFALLCAKVNMVYPYASRDWEAGAVREDDCPVAASRYGAMVLGPWPVQSITDWEGEASRSNTEIQTKTKTPPRTFIRSSLVLCLVLFHRRNQYGCRWLYLMRSV